ncbi:Type IV fimbrial biogenesis protein [Lysobacter enzymogenes]|uniref:Type II secretion system protein H n=1 Tax=Lysobacter enzymogenes TaxID=69 RepID=A0A0S2DK98_LYSEN
MKRMQGISVIEVALALAVVAVLTGVAAPAALSALLAVRYASVRAALGESVLMSNRVSVASGGVAVVCPSDPGGRCRDDADWSSGWLVYADIDEDRRFGAGDVLLRRQPPLPDGLRLVTTDGRRRIVFHPDGSNSGSNVTFSLCSRSGDRVESLVLSNAGRLRIAPGSDEQRSACRGR